MTPPVSGSAPSGIDLHPDPPPAAQVSKRAGIAGVVVVGMVLACFAYGLYERQARQDRANMGMQKPDASRMTAATAAAKQITMGMPTSSLAARDATQKLDGELVPPLQAQPATPVAPQANQPVMVPPAAHPHPPAAPMQQREPTPEERRRMLAFQREQEALEAPTGTRGSFPSAGQGYAGSPSLPTPEGDMSQMAALLQAMQGPAGSQSRPGSQATGGRALAGGTPRISLLPSQSDEFAAQNNQDRKEAFLAAARARTSEPNYVNSTRTAPLGPYEIKAGWDIPAVLEQSLNSDLPGEIRALVRENVYDTATGHYLLIPQGARLVGSYDSNVSYGQDGLQVVWQRVVFPDASSINLEGLVGQDAHGASGFRHDVDNHYRRLVGFGLLTSVFQASFYLSQSRRANVFSNPSATELIGTGVGRDLSQLGAEVTRRNLNIQPTVKVPVGYRFNVRVNRDMLFDAPYRPLAQ